MSRESPAGFFSGTLAMLQSAGRVSPPPAASRLSASCRRFLGKAKLFFTEGNMVSTPRFVAFIIGFVGLAALLIIDSDGYISIIDDANLLFHEAGHLIFGLFGPTLGLYGGTLGQLAIPIICGVAFWRQRSWVSVSVALLWFFENIFNIAPYVADARSQELPLVGGGEHDWTNILSRWGVLQHDTTMATTMKVVGWLGLFPTFAWTTYLWWPQKRTYTRDPFEEWH